MKLLLHVLSKFISGTVLMVLIIFLPAGTFRFINAWIFLSFLLIPMFITGIVLYIKNPSLLQKRLNAKEKENTQKSVVALNGLMFLSGFIIAGLDFRFRWSNVPKWMVITACVIFLISYILYAEVIRENTYLSRTIEVREGQKVIDKGLYSIVRHPMYSVTIFLFLSMPIILGSWYSFVIFLFYPFLIAVRIKNEEKVLELNLEGYKEYRKKVKYRLIPFIW